MFWPGIVFGGGPYFQHKDPIVQQEFEWAYQNIRTVLTEKSGAKCIDDPTFCVDTVNNWVLKPSQPSFLAAPSAALSDVTGDGTTYTLAANSEIYDLNSDYDTGTYTFTAPVGGYYDFDICVGVNGVDIAEHEYILVVLDTSNRDYEKRIYDATNLLRGEEGVCFSVLADMDTSDTAKVTVAVGGGADPKTADIRGGIADLRTWFSGSLKN